MRRLHRTSFIVAMAMCGVLLVAFVAVSVAATIVAEQGKEDKKPIFCTTMDTGAPVIELRGDEVVNINVGAEYNDAGVDVYEYCEVKLVTDSSVNTAVAGEYRVKYTATDEMGNETVVRRKVYVRPAYHGTIYLTFDDGPGIYTDALLDILAKYNVKATFFVTGAGDDATILREYQEGHAIGLHTWSHDYSYVYANMDNFFADLTMIAERVKNITGEETHLMRFPGGSSNTVSAKYDGGTRIMSALTREVERRGYAYFDWNVSSGDAGGAYTTDEVFGRVIDNLIDGGSSVVLQHDIKGFSVDAVESIIEYGISHGYVFDKLTPDSFAAHHGVNN